MSKIKKKEGKIRGIHLDILTAYYIESGNNMYIFSNPVDINQCPGLPHQFEKINLLLLSATNGPINGECWGPHQKN